jgi:SAM-dependent methyltransferase
MNIAELTRDNPRLIELEQAYAKLNLFDHSLWKTWADQIDITRFRGENAYLAQMWMMTEERYRNTLHYALDLGYRHMIESLDEDDAFGCVTFTEDMGANEDDIVYSRDLLDSVFEIKFLREALGYTDKSLPIVFDIGAGYGRFAYRFSQAMDKSYVYCFDAVPLSTFLCQFYLQYRNCEKRARVIPLHMIDTWEFPHVDLACNMYSFSEIPLSAVNFWLDFCADLNVRHFYLVPHAPDLIHPAYLTTEPDGSHLDYYPLFERHGYKLKVQRPKLPIYMSNQLIYNTSYLLLERG